MYFFTEKIYFRNSWYFPQISVWSCHWFLEGIRFSWVIRNWVISHPLNFVFFVFHNDRNYPCVSGHFVSALDDWLSHFWHIWIVWSIKFFKCVYYSIICWRLCVNLFIVVRKIWWIFFHSSSHFLPHQVLSLQEGFILGLTWESCLPLYMALYHIY